MAEKPLPPLTIHLTWGDVENAVENLANQILDTGYIYKVDNRDDVCLVPIVRGGLPIATMLSHRLNGLPVRPITYQTRDGKERDIGRLVKYWRRWRKLIIVEDIIDTGATMEAINIHLNDIADGERGQYVALASLCKNNDMKWSAFRFHWNALMVDREAWVVFPWERKAKYYSTSDF